MRFPTQNLTPAQKDALEAAQMGMWEWDMHTNQINWSRGVETLFGMQPGEFDGSFEMFVSRIPLEDRPLLEKAIERALTTSAPLVVEHRVVHDNGVTRWVRGQGDTVRDAHGRPIQMIGICQDVTERIQEKAALRVALEHAESANRLKNAILANMSHEIRTPMTAILGYSELLIQRLQTLPELRYAEVINSGGKRLLHLLDNIVDLARIEADRLELTNEAHLLPALINRVVEMMQVLAQRKGLLLRVHAQEPVWAWSDPRRTEQVLTNLISNAIRFTEKGSIAVRCYVAGVQADGRFAAISIEDTGIGIEETFLPHAFDEFRQESEGLARNYEGSGLGLSIVKRLLDTMGGKISIRSQRGIGTTVEILLPLASQGQIQTAAPQTQKAAPLASRARLLVVEDEPATGHLVQEYLRSDYEVVWLDNAEAALDEVKQKPGFDLILLDIHLKPGRMDGLSALRLLRSRMAPRSPVLALTAYAMKGDQERFLAEGFDGYLAKPFDLTQLREAVAGQLAKGAEAQKL